MAHRIDVMTTIPDTRAVVRKNRLLKKGYSTLQKCSIMDSYTIDANLSDVEVRHIAAMVSNPVTQTVSVNAGLAPIHFDHAIEIGFLPGVTDNQGTTVREAIEDLLKRKVGDGQIVYTSQITFLSGSLSKEELISIGNELANPLIQRIHIKNEQSFHLEKGMGITIPKVSLVGTTRADVVEIINLSDAELVKIGKQGIANEDGSRRGPLALDHTYMKTIQSHFQKKGRNPTDIELESIAQTWSEHCKHTIFADPIDDIEQGIFKTYIQAATEKIRKVKGDADFCVSVFTDNSGAIAFDEHYLITDKAETHNSPSALDPFGGAITGIVGVNRDTIGFGLGAKPVINRYGYCFGNPDDTRPLYKGEKFAQKMRSPRMIMDGVIEGVNVGGNQSGIPTPQGFMVFDSRYTGKPLVFVGTIGLLPREHAGKKLHEKKANPGDSIVVVGGKVGKDGIHGATFSSEALDSGSPATAVQIGDPITQKKLSDALVKEARDLGMYTSITDNGAGGLSCSVAEMAKECGGCTVELEKVPVKYPGLAPWEIWISESQERMTVSVSLENVTAFISLMEKRGVDATVIGQFNDSGKCIVLQHGTTVMDIDMEFLHNGLPPRKMQSVYEKPSHPEPSFPFPDDCAHSLLNLVGRLNNASISFISEQYDHEVQGGSVTKPLQGKGKVNADATVTRPVLSSQKGVVTSQGINPQYSDIDTYAMAACAIDTAIRNAVCTGANPQTIALMDNFCWCSSIDPQRLGELKAAAKACFDYAVAYGTPFISGKDSMFNDFKGYDAEGKSITISIPPTLLISSVSVMNDSKKAVTLDVKQGDDLIYLLGETHDELGGSDYFALVGEEKQGTPYIGNRVPRVDAEKNKKVYSVLARAIDHGMIASAVSVHRGGLGYALARTAMAGKKGVTVSLSDIPGNTSRDDFALFSESQGRIVITINPAHKEAFEKECTGIAFKEIGTVSGTDSLVITGGNTTIVSTPVSNLLSQYNKRFEGY